MFRTSHFAALAAAVAVASFARADVIKVPAVLDNTLWNDLAGQTSSGAGQILFVGRAAGMASFPIRRALIAFDVAGFVPAGATVTSARLILSNPSGNIGPRNVELHRVLASWGEGASNATSGQGDPAQPGDATWLHRSYPNVFWSAPGGDFAAASSSTLIVDQLGVQTWSSTASTVADVQAWLDMPSSNFGWLVKLDNESTPQTTKVFDSREATEIGVRPMLEIVFTPPQPLFTYCVAQTNSLGCTPAIGASGTASASSGSGFVVALANAVNNKSGLLSYSTFGAAATPFHTGTLCLATPARRTPLQFSGGSPGPADCSGSFALDFNAFTATGADPALAAGAIVWCQYSSRDPGDPSHFNASDALRFELGP
jgi:hypothetical protein